MNIYIKTSMTVIAGVLLATGASAQERQAKEAVAQEMETSKLKVESQVRQISPQALKAPQSLKAP